GTQPVSIPLSASVEVPAATARPRLATGFWRRALRHRSFVVGGALSLMVLCAALLSLVWTPWSAYEIDVASKLRPPSAAHWLRHHGARPPHGRRHRGRDRPYFRGVPRADRVRAQGLDRRAHHADERLHLRVSRGALRHHAGGRSPAPVWGPGS